VIEHAQGQMAQLSFVYIINTIMLRFKFASTIVVGDLNILFLDNKG
jgi:hypothetical protein